MERQYVCPCGTANGEVGGKVVPIRKTRRKEDAGHTNTKKEVRKQQILFGGRSQKIGPTEGGDEDDKLESGDDQVKAGF